VGANLLIKSPRRNEPPPNLYFLHLEEKLMYDERSWTTGSYSENYNITKGITILEQKAIYKIA